MDNWKLTVWNGFQSLETVVSGSYEYLSNRYGYFPPGYIWSLEPICEGN